LLTLYAGRSRTTVAHSNLFFTGYDVIGLRKPGNRLVLDVVNVHFDIEIHGWEL
jgi:hypothetical protein